MCAWCAAFLHIHYVRSEAASRAGPFDIPNDLQIDTHKSGLQYVSKLRLHLTRKATGE